MAESDDITARDANQAAEIMADVAVEQIADVYAQALLGAAEKEGVTDAVLAEFEELATEVLDRWPKFETILASGLIPHEDKVGIIDRAFGPTCSPLLVSFLKVVSRHGRLDCLRVIHRQVRLLHDQLRGRVHVRLTTATEIDDAAARRIAEQLLAGSGGRAVVERSVDSDLIGGAVLRVGDTVYDGSVARQLQIIRQKMIDRSAHEIQGRRDRFRDPAGS